MCIRGVPAVFFGVSVGFLRYFSGMHVFHGDLSLSLSLWVPAGFLGNSLGLRGFCWISAAYPRVSREFPAHAFVCIVFLVFVCVLKKIECISFFGCWHKTALALLRHGC